jgi:hypothetical protein
MVAWDGGDYGRERLADHALFVEWRPASVARID